MKAEVFFTLVCVLCVEISGGTNNYYGYMKGINGISSFDDSYLNYWQIDEKEQNPGGPSNNNTDVIKNSKEDEEYYEPCYPHHNDECIRNFLSSSGQCYPVYRPNGKNIVYREQGVIYAPKVNFTLIQKYSSIEGLNKNIVEQFYINKKTNRLVYAVNFEQIHIPSKNAYYIFHRRGREPIIIQDELDIQYPPTILTAVIPLNKYGLSLKDAMITAFINGLPTYTVGPRVQSNPDPAVQFMLATTATTTDSTTPEALLTEAPNFFVAYLQNFICDYGIHV